MDKQEQTDQDRCRGHVLFAKSCSPCPLPVWPVITERLGLSADCRWPCVDPDNLQSNHMMAALAPRATGSSTVTLQNKRTFKISSSQHRSRDRRRLQVSLLSTDGKSSTGNVSYSGFYSPLCHFSATSVPCCCASKQKVHFKVSLFAAVRSASTDTGPRLVVLVVIYPKSSGKATFCGRRVLTGSRCQLSEGLFSLVHTQYV